MRRCDKRKPAIVERHWKLKQEVVTGVSETCSCTEKLSCKREILLDMCVVDRDRNLRISSEISIGPSFMTSKQKAYTPWQTNTQILSTSLVQKIDVSDQICQFFSIHNSL